MSEEEREADDILSLMEDIKKTKEM